MFYPPHFNHNFGYFFVFCLSQKTNVCVNHHQLITILQANKYQYDFCFSENALDMPTLRCFFLLFPILFFSSFIFSQTAHWLMLMVIIRKPNHSRGVAVERGKSGYGDGYAVTFSERSYYYMYIVIYNCIFNSAFRHVQFSLKSNCIFFLEILIWFFSHSFQHFVVSNVNNFVHD